MPITPQEAHEFCDRWLTTVLGRGTPAEQAPFFVNPDSRLYILEDGGIMTFQDNYRLHCRLTNEIHSLGEMTLTVLNAAPDRVRATGRFYWQAEYAEKRPQPNVIKALAGIDCIIERVAAGAERVSAGAAGTTAGEEPAASGELKFVLYMSSFHQLLPDSAPLQVE